MKLITRDTDYAIRILCYLAGKQGRVTVVAMVRDLKIPAAFLRRITQRLSKSGLLHSVRGLSGGFALIARPEDIRLLDVLEIFQGDCQLNDCLFKKEVCPNRKTCFMRMQILDIERYALAKLRSVTVAGILKAHAVPGAQKDDQE